MFDEEEAVAGVVTAPKLADHHGGKLTLVLIAAGLEPRQHGEPDVTLVAFRPTTVG